MNEGFELKLKEGCRYSIRVDPEFPTVSIDETDETKPSGTITNIATFQFASGVEKPLTVMNFTVPKSKGKLKLERFWINLHLIGAEWRVKGKETS